MKCNQQLKVLLRFPIADLRRSGSTNISATTTTTTTSTTSQSGTASDIKQQQQPQQATSSSTTTNPTSSSSSSTTTASNPAFVAATQHPTPVNHIKPQTMIAFRRLRDQCLTLHVFDLAFQTIQQPHALTAAPTVAQSLHGPDLLTLTIVCSQINTYYQYSRRERPIHFGLVQAKLGEPRSLYCSIKLPLEDDYERFDECFSGGAGGGGQLLDETRPGAPMSATEMDSLKHVYNIDFGRPNRFSQRKSTTIKEENEPDRQFDPNDDNDRHSDSERDEVSFIIIIYLIFLVNFLI